ncbi:hypothetical protein Pcac1_g919 [Phytophthora cactorum]|nr:hypothetical protein Pcac1_g919 [Phytophthora cactorum]
MARRRSSPLGSRAASVLSFLLALAWATSAASSGLRLSRRAFTRAIRWALPDCESESEADEDVAGDIGGSNLMSRSLADTEGAAADGGSRIWSTGCTVSVVVFRCWAPLALAVFCQICSKATGSDKSKVSALY